MKAFCLALALVRTTLPLILISVRRTCSPACPVGCRTWSRGVRTVTDNDTTPKHPYAQSTYHCVCHVQQLVVSLWYNRERFLTMSICFRRINHLHSFSGLREVVFDTRTSPITEKLFNTYETLVHKKLTLKFFFIYRYLLSYLCKTGQELMVLTVSLWDRRLILEMAKTIGGRLVKTLTR